MFKSKTQMDHYRTNHNFTDIHGNEDSSILGLKRKKSNHPEEIRKAKVKKPSYNEKK